MILCDYQGKFKNKIKKGDSAIGWLFLGMLTLGPQPPYGEKA